MERRSTAVTPTGAVRLSGNVTIDDLTIATRRRRAARAAGPAAAEVARGLGGGLRSKRRAVTLDDVAFRSDDAIGGAGGDVKPSPPEGAAEVWAANGGSYQFWQRARWRRRGRANGRGHVTPTSINFNVGTGTPVIHVGGSSTSTSLTSPPTIIKPVIIGAALNGATRIELEEARPATAPTGSLLPPAAAPCRRWSSTNSAAPASC